MIRLPFLGLALLGAYLTIASRVIAHRPARVPAICPACQYQGCDGSLARCPGRWL